MHIITAQTMCQILRRNFIINHTSCTGQSIFSFLNLDWLLCACMFTTPWTVEFLLVCSGFRIFPILRIFASLIIVSIHFVCSSFWCESKYLLIAEWNFSYEVKHTDVLCPVVIKAISAHVWAVPLLLHFFSSILVLVEVITSFSEVLMLTVHAIDLFNPSHCTKHNHIVQKR